MSKTRSLDELLKELPRDCQMEVRDFAEFLLARHCVAKGSKLRQDWAESLREHRDTYTAVELQHKASTWRVK